MASPIREQQQFVGGAGNRLNHFALSFKRGRSAPSLVDHIVLAEFDIDSGSTVRHTYPNPVPDCSDDWFAEHMLPEGAHNHALDWTVMFLNRGQKSLDEDWPSRLHGEEGAGEEGAGAGGGEAQGSRLDEGVCEEEGDSCEPRLGGDGEKEDARNFLHCINLVRKQDDPSVRRGAVVKAMCVCSRYNYIEVFRPMLMIALEQYYQTPVPGVLVSLFDALNTADIAGAPRPTPWERGLMRRGIADKYMGTVPVEHLTSTWTYMMTFDYGERKVQASLPLYAFPDETLGPSVQLLVNLFGQSFMTVYNAVLTGQRVLFVGYNHAAGDVCRIVLAACALVSPPIEGILHRAFPYASLSDLSFLETPSFVAGVTNPMFEAHPEWWDVLCQLDLPRGSGTVLTAEEVATDGGSGLHKAKPGGGGSTTHGAGHAEERKDMLLYPGDVSFATKLMAGVKSGKGESWARGECHDYTQELVNLLLDQEAGLVDRLLSVSLDKMLQANEGRLRRLKEVGGFSRSDIDPWARCRGPGGGQAAGGQGGRLRNTIRRFQLEKNVGESQVREAFELLCESLHTEAELQVLLGLLPESKGGLGLLALGLLSKNPSTRRSTVTLFKKLESFDSTRPAVLCMNDFLKLSLSRQAQELDPPRTPPPSTPASASAAVGVGGVRGMDSRRIVPA